MKTKTTTLESNGNGVTTAISRLFSDKGLTKKAYLNAIAMALDYSAKLIVGFLVIPLLVASLGDYLYGIWKVLGRMTGYVTSASGRPIQALKLTIANQQSSTDYDDKRRHVGSAIIVWVLFLPVLLVIGGLFTWFLPSLLKVSSEYVWVVRLAAGVLALKMTLISLVAIPRSVLDGENLAYKRMGLTALVAIFGGGLTVLAVKLGAGLIGVATATLLTAILTGLFFLILVRRYVHWFGIARPSSQSVRKFFRLSGWVLIWRWVYDLMLASDIVLLGMLTSMQLVTSYSLTKFVPAMLINLAFIGVAAMKPGLGGIIGSGDLQKAKRIRGEMMSFTWLLATVVGAVVLLWNAAFLSLWVGSGYYSGSLANLLITLMVVQFVMIRNDSNIIELTLDLSTKVMMGIVSAALSLGIAFMLIKFFQMGVVGLCVGLIIGRLILSVGYPIIIGRVFGISWRTQLTGAIRPMVVTALVFWMVSKQDIFLKQGLFEVQNWAGFILSVGATLAIVSAVVFYAGLTSVQRLLLIKRFQGALSVSR